MDLDALDLDALDLDALDLDAFALPRGVFTLAEFALGTADEFTGESTGEFILDSSPKGASVLGSQSIRSTFLDIAFPPGDDQKLPRGHTGLLGAIAIRLSSVASLPQPQQHLKNSVVLMLAICR
ncbi:MAG: hypothetical protein AAF889_07950 [Cyanobacteria bacterium P01_D01_bin.73]